MPLRDMCFLSTDVSPVPDDRTDSVPWWLAIVIAIPLTVITVAIIKILLIIRKKKLRQAEEKSRRKSQDYAKLEDK